MQMRFLKHWRFLLLALLPVAMLAVFSACSSSNENNPSGSAGGASGSGGAIPSGPPSDLAPDAQQTLSVNIRAEPSSIDPQAQSYTYEATVVKNTYATLLDEDPATGQLVPT